MKLHSCLILFTLLCLLPDHTTAIKKIRKRDALAIYSIVNILPKGRLIVKDLYQLWNSLLKEPDLDISSALIRGRQEETIRYILEVSSKLTALEQEVRTVSGTTIRTVLQAFPKLIKLELKLHELTLITNQINFAEEQLRKYLILGYQNITSVEVQNIRSPEIMENALFSMHNTSLDQDVNDVSASEEMSNNIVKRQADDRWLVEQFTLLDFTTWTTGHSFNSLISLLRRMNDLVINQEDHGLFNLINEASEVRVYCTNFGAAKEQVTFSPHLQK